jgi:hypothetical protein
MDYRYPGRAGALLTRENDGFLRQRPALTPHDVRGRPQNIVRILQGHDQVFLQRSIPGFATLLLNRLKNGRTVRHTMIIPTTSL